MGRSFDRGGQSRKERERGKRRSYRQAERDREARDAVAHAKRIAAPGAVIGKKQPRYAAVVASTTVAQDMPITTPTAVAAAEPKRPGFFAQVFQRFFKKSA